MFLLLGGLITALAWLWPGSYFCALLAWLGVFFLVTGLRRSEHPYRHSYYGAIILNSIGFYWLSYTISSFGGFGYLASFALFSLFVLLSSVQFLLAVLIWHNLPDKLRALCLSTPLAFVAAEVISIRLFPWHFGHSQLAFAPLAQVADLGGTFLISFLMFWLAEALCSLGRTKKISAAILFPVAMLTAATIYGSLRIRQIDQISAPALQVALVQANISVEEKHQVKLLIPNVLRYLELSKKIAQEQTLIVWPESVILSWIYSGIGSVQHDPRLPFLGENVPMLVGALTYKMDGSRYNSALAIMPDGSVPTPYHKQILMPFGEFVPFAATFPWLRDLAAGIEDFAAGNEIVLFDYPLLSKDQKQFTLRAAPLICYEDVVARLAREAVSNGATLLINLTNDGWFGNSAALRQHHLIASFRAIENRRYLLRATNTGLTAIVDPTGRTISELVPFSEGVLINQVRSIDYKSVFSRFNLEIWWQALSWLTLLLACFRIYRARIRPNTTVTP